MWSWLLIWSLVAHSKTVLPMGSPCVSLRLPAHYRRDICEFCTTLPHAEAGATFADDSSELDDSLEDPDQESGVQLGVVVPCEASTSNLLFKAIDWHDWDGGKAGGWPVRAPFQFSASILIFGQYPAKASQHYSESRGACTSRHLMWLTWSFMRIRGLSASSTPRRAITNGRHNGEECCSTLRPTCLPLG